MSKQTKPKPQLACLVIIATHKLTTARPSRKQTVQKGPAGDAGRKRAAPHIKTYIRYAASGSRDDDSGDDSGKGKAATSQPRSEAKFIDWAMLTSANISKQAWGEAAAAAASGGATGQLRIASWEIGVLVWPELLAPPSSAPNPATSTARSGAEARMVPTFRTDMPDHSDSSNNGEEDQAGNKDGEGGALVGLRIPYALPLRRYADDEAPWVATASYREPDWMGRTWQDA